MKPSLPAQSQEVMDVARVSYARTLAAVIAHHCSYPLLARMQRMQGKVELSLRLASSGRVIGATVSRSSGFELLDQEALEMVKQAEPLPSPPVSLADKALSVVVPVVFRLEG